MKFIQFLTVVAVCTMLVVGTAAIFQQSGSQGYGTPFNSYLAPVATGPTAVTALAGVFRFYCNNNTGIAATLTVTDTAGVSFVTAFSLPANSNVSIPPGGYYMKLTGVKTSTGTNNAINCLVEGYTP